MISGSFDPPAVGKVLFPYTRTYQDGSGIIRFTAESATAMSSVVFECVLPYIRGRIIRVSAFGVFGAMPVSTGTVAVVDPQGGSWSASVTTSGSKDALGAPTGWIDGRPRLTISTLGGSGLQMEIVLHIQESLQTATGA